MTSGTCIVEEFRELVYRLLCCFYADVRGSIHTLLQSGRSMYYLVWKGPYSNRLRRHWYMYWWCLIYKLLLVGSLLMTRACLKFNVLQLSPQ
jgi:hypothetical protein